MGLRHSVDLWGRWLDPRVAVLFVGILNFSVVLCT